MTPPNIDILQNLEFTVVQMWKDDAELVDAEIGRAYEAAFQRYRAESRGHAPKPVSLAGRELALYEALVDMAESRRSERQNPGSPEAAAVFMDCFRELGRSVERHGRTGGRRGYLEFIKQFLT